MLLDMSKHVTVQLTEEQRSRLLGLIHAGDAPARTQTRARVLLHTDRSQGQLHKDEAVAAACLCSKGTVGNIRRRFAAEGLDAALKDRPLPGAKPKITGAVEAHLVSLACSDPPAGEARWTLRLLADRLVALGLLDSITPAAVHGRLKKTNSSPGR